MQSNQPTSVEWLINAAANGEDAAIKTKLNEMSEDTRKALINQVVNRTSALHEAVNKHYESTVRLLLSYGANPNSEGDLGETPLHRAAYDNNTNIIKILLDHGASCESPRNDLEKAIHLAAMNGSAEAVDVLIAHNKNQSDITGSEQKTALYRAVEYGKNNVIEILLKNGVDINKPFRFHYNKTALHVAAMKNQYQSVKLLIEKGADLNAKDTAGLTPLARCAMQNNLSLESARILIGKGANVDEGNPLYRLAIYEHQSSPKVLAFAKLLIEKGANTQAAYNGETAFDALETRKCNDELNEKELALYRYLGSDLTPVKSSAPTNSG